MSIYIIVDSDELEFYCMERFGIENEVVSDYLSNREDYYKFFEQFKKEEIIDIYCHITPTIFSKYISTIPPLRDALTLVFFINSDTFLFIPSIAISPTFSKFS